MNLRGQGSPGGGGSGRGGFCPNSLCLWRKTTFVSNKLASERSPFFSVTSFWGNKLPPKKGKILLFFLLSYCLVLVHVLLFLLCFLLFLFYLIFCLLFFLSLFFYPLNMQGRLVCGRSNNTRSEQRRWPEAKGKATKNILSNFVLFFFLTFSGENYCHYIFPQNQPEGAYFLASRSPRLTLEVCLCHSNISRPSGMSF